MPELPEVQAHAERLTAQFAGTKLKKFVPLTFTALKTALPRPDAAYGLPLESVGRRGKYLLLRFEPVTFIVHLMQGGRLLVDEKQSAKPRNGQARFVFADGPALLLTEAGTERRRRRQRPLDAVPKRPKGAPVASTAQPNARGPAQPGAQRGPQQRVKPRSKGENPGRDKRREQ